MRAAAAPSTHTASRGVRPAACTCIARSRASLHRARLTSASKPECIWACGRRNAAAFSRATDVRAQAQASTSEAGSTSGGAATTLLLGALFAGWYIFNIVFNIYNKRVLSAVPCPITLTAYQFLVGSLVGVLWFVASGTRPLLSRSNVLRILPLACAHTLGNLLTNMSLGMVAVSFTHTIKAMEPFFSVLLSAIFLGDTPSPLVLLTLLPIVGGVACASLSEVSFNWPGFASAMGSNLTFQSRNVLSKKSLTPTLKDELGGSIGLFSLITVLSFFILAPIALLRDGIVLTPGALSAAGIEPNSLLSAATVAALTFHLYQQVSYMILARVSPVTHSIGNCVKRVIVIVASVIVFRNPMTLQSKISTAVALAGVFAYSQVKRMKAKAT